MKTRACISYLAAFMVMSAIMIISLLHDREPFEALRRSLVGGGAAGGVVLFFILIAAAVVERHREDDETKNEQSRGEI